MQKEYRLYFNFFTHSRLLPLKNRATPQHIKKNIANKARQITITIKSLIDPVKPLAWASNGNEPIKNRLKINFFICKIDYAHLPRCAVIYKKAWAT